MDFLLLFCSGIEFLGTRLYYSCMTFIFKNILRYHFTCATMAIIKEKKASIGKGCGNVKLCIHFEK
jgi:hypothetical protein